MEYCKGLKGGYPYARAITRILEYCVIILGRESPKAMKRTSLVTSNPCSKNMRIFKDVDGIFKHTDADDVVAPLPDPKGSYTLELIYKKLHQMNL